MNNSEINLEQAFKLAKLIDSRDGGLKVVERLSILKSLKTMLLKNQEAIVDAISEDFGNRSKHETLMADIVGSLAALNQAIKKTPEWIQPSACSIPLMYQPAKAEIIPQAKGVVGIICPWNYPIQLAISPLASAIAAGNRVLLKLSEHAPKLSLLLADLFNDKAFTDYIWVINGDVDVAEAFSQLPFDHILFTGSAKTARKLMSAAAKNLTPLTIELGGKSPAIIAHDASNKETYERILFGKLFNAGQTCVAPDFVWLPQADLNLFIETFQQIVQQFYQQGSESKDYSAIINQQRFDQLNTLVAAAITAGCRVVKPEIDWQPIHERCFMPTLVINPKEDLAIMQEEIFGPVLPILTYATEQEIIEYQKRQEQPLTVSLFCNDKEIIQRYCEQLRSGSISINEVLIHAGIETLPLGGIGASGFGRYHGKDGFETFSQMKPVFRRGKPNFNAFFIPPYGKMADLIIHILIKKLA